MRSQLVLLPGRLGGQKARKRPKPLPWPHAASLDYAATLTGLVDRLQSLTEKQLVAKLPQLVAGVDRRSPSVRQDDIVDTLTRILHAISLALGLSDRKARAWASRVLETVNDQHAQNFVLEYEKILAINPLAGAEPWLREQMRLALEDNVALIKSLPEDVLGSVRSLVTRSILDGTRVEDLAALIAGRFDVGYSRAMLIATDQTGKWFGSLQRLRQLDAGIARYEWSTSLDEAVRPAHRAREGKVFEWAHAPDGGHPGMAVRCRCQAIPVLDD